MQSTDASQHTTSDDKLRNLSEHENLLLGVTTGVTEQVVVQPLVFWKTSVQQGVPFTMNPKIVMRGTSSSCSSMAALTGIQFISSGYLQKLIAGDIKNQMSWGQEVACAFLGGAISGPACCMMELTMIQQQRFGGTMLGTLHRIKRDHGCKGLTRGLIGSTLREAIFTAGYLGTVPASQKYIRENVTVVSPPVGQCIGTLAAAYICAAITQPIDTAKTCMQGDLEKRKYGSFFGTLQTLRKEYGSTRALYRGYFWRSANIVADFFLIDSIAAVLAPLIFPAKMC